MDAQRLALHLRQGPDIVLSLGGKLVALLDALEAGGKNDRVGQVGVGRGVDAAELHPRGLGLAGLVHGDAHQGGAVVVAPAHVAGGLVPSPQALVGVDVLVGDGRDLRGVVQQAGDEGATGGGELVLAGGVEEGVAVALEQGEVRVHARTELVGEGLGHEGGQAALLQGDLLDDGAEGHDVVRHGQGVGEAQVDLVLARATLMVGELHRDPHLLKHEDGLAAEVVGSAPGHVVEVAGVVSGADAPVGVAVDQVELDLRVDVAGEAGLGDPGELTLKHRARVGAGRLAVGREDVAEHAGHAVVPVPPRQHLECGGVRGQEHVGLEDARESLDRRSVEADALLEGALDLGRCDGHGLELPGDVSEPQADEADVAFLDGSEHVLLLLVHGASSAWGAAAGRRRGRRSCA